jgi:hypothetical protein
MRDRALADLPDDILKIEAMGPVGTLLARQFSERGSAAMSKRTAESLRYHTRVFGEVVGARDTLDADALNTFYEFLETSSYSPATKQTLYKHGCGISRYLIDSKLIGHFRVPGRYRHAAVLSVTPPPRRVTDGVRLADTELTDDKMLNQIVSFAYEELEAWRHKRALAAVLATAAREAYRAVLEATKQAWPAHSFARMDTTWADAVLAAHGSGLERHGFPTNGRDLASLAFCILFAHEHYNGIPRTVTEVRRLPDDQKIPGEVRYASMIIRVGSEFPGLFPSMLCPGQDEAAALAVLLAAAHVNADSVVAMKAACLKATRDPNVFVLAWHKARAGGEMEGLGFPNRPANNSPDCEDNGAAEIDEKTGEMRRQILARGATDAVRSIPTAIRDYLKASAPLRAAMDMPDGPDGVPHPDAKLLLVQPDKVQPGATGFTCSARTLRRGVEAFAARLQERIVVAHSEASGFRIGLKSIRVSAIHQFRRSSGSMNATVIASQHASRDQTAYYLRHRDVMALNSEETRRIVNALDHAVRTGTLILVAADHRPTGAVDIGHGLTCRNRHDSQMPGQRPDLPCDFFLGCLSCERAIVVATPLNYARLARYREHLISSRQRRDQNPERWHRWVMPMLPVLEQALADFPPETAAEGTKLAARLRLDFGAIW